MTAEDTVFFSRNFIRLKGKLFSLETPFVMGILNITPDSFYDGGKYSSEDQVLTQANKLVSEGASIIDLGAVSTRPRAKEISVSEELNRLLPTLKLLNDSFPETPISVDTFRSEVAKEAVACGAAMINDISGGTMDPFMLDTVAELGVPYVLSHIQRTPGDMQQDPHYDDIVAEVMDFLLLRLKKLQSIGLADVIIDPGFGFGKTVEHNYTLLRKLSLLRMLDCPIMVGLSRKSMVNKVIGVGPDDALNGTTVLHTIALLHHASILRVHDVREAMETIRLVQKFHS